MGNDASLAVLSDRPRLLYDYFAQLFAQVTNPPLDAIREKLVTSMESTVGPEGNLLEPTPQACRQIGIRYPIIDNEQLAKLRHIRLDDFRSETLPMLFDPAEDGPGLERAMADLSAAAEKAVRDGINILILSDRGVSETEAPIPSLLATAGVHHHLVRTGLRTRCGLVIESGDAREVHHVALLMGYGAGAVNPYLAFETLDDLMRQGSLEALSHTQAVIGYIKALNLGILKVMSKMGISALQSYCGAQIFEAIGLERSFVDKYFTSTASRIGGVGIDVVAEEVRLRHQQAYGPRAAGTPDLDSGGEYQWRRDGEFHLFNPETVFKLQHATRSGQYAIYREYARAVNDQSRRLGTLRGLFELQRAETAVPLDEVEPVESIVKRFATGAMSYGSISQEAHETLAIAMNRLGGKSNSGEGGEDPERYRKDPNGDWRRSAVKQVASARFGVTSEYLVNCSDLQIKMAQGAKPGEGGQLPGFKVYPWIAKVRHSTPGVTLISPPPHHDIYSIEDLAQLIYDLKNANHHARIHVKLVAEVGVGTVAAGVAKAHADVVLISGPRRRDGRLAADEHQARRRAVGARPGRDPAGAHAQPPARPHRRAGGRPDEDRPRRRDRRAARRRGVRVCDRAARRVGLHHDARLPPEHLSGRHCDAGSGAAGEVRRQAGVRRELLPVRRRGSARADVAARIPDDRRDGRPRRPARRAPGRRALEGGWARPVVAPGRARRAGAVSDAGACSRRTTASPRRSTTSSSAAAEPALTARKRVDLRFPIRNVNRTVGTMLGAELTRRYGGLGLPDDTIHIQFTGSAGQSFGAFVPRGMTLQLEGDANDYFGKGLSGGKLLVYPPEAATFAPEENVIIGNVALYGATGGEAYVRGLAGERFAVRNSGAMAVVEGVGDHGCEYMTGGRVVVLGRTGRNFAAGMSGGIAYVFDPSRTVPAAVQPCARGSRDGDERRGRGARPRPDHPARPLHGQRARAADPQRLAEDTQAVRQGDAARLQARADGRGARAGRRSRTGVRGTRRGGPWVRSPAFSRSIGPSRRRGLSRSASATGRRSTCRSPSRTCGTRAPAAWTAAFPSATRDARSATSFPTGTTSSTGIAGVRRSSACTRRTTFPEWTGRLCPAPCEASCVLGINDDPVTIKSIELSIVDRAFDEGWIVAEPPPRRTGKRVAVVGSGPAGLAAAQQLNRAGHTVTVFERDDRIGGLLRYGIPEFKMEKRFLDRRLDQLEAEGVTFRTGVNVGVDLPAAELRATFDAVVLTGGAGWARDLHVPGRELDGHSLRDGVPDAAEPPVRRRRGRADDAVHLGRRQARRHHRRRRHRRRLSRHRASPGRDVGAPVRAAAAAARRARAEQSLAGVAATSSACPPAHEEGGERVFSVSTQRFTGDADGRVRAAARRRRWRGRQEDGRTDVQADRRAASLRWTPTWSCWPWGSSGPERDGLARPISASGSPTAETCGPTNAG